MRTVPRGIGGKRTSNAYLFDDDKKARILELNAFTQKAKSDKVLSGQELPPPNGAKNAPRSLKGTICPQSG